MAWRPGILHRDEPYLSVPCAGQSSTNDMLGTTLHGVKRLCLLQSLRKGLQTSGLKKKRLRELWTKCSRQPST